MQFCKVGQRQRNGSYRKVNQLRVKKALKPSLKYEQHYTQSANKNKTYNPKQSVMASHVDDSRYCRRQLWRFLWEETSDLFRILIGGQESSHDDQFDQPEYKQVAV